MIVMTTSPLYLACRVWRPFVPLPGVPLTGLMGIAVTGSID
jgi:hypothetical protein